MKNKVVLGITVLILMVGSFFGGSYFEKQKIKLDEQKLHIKINYQITNKNQNMLSKP